MLEVLLAVFATTMVRSPDEAPASDPATYLQICDSGGWRSETCSVLCHRVFNYWTTTCNVSCRSGYYACCSCENGCECVLDHDEMWPLPPTPIPSPKPQPDPDDASSLE
jgi:hypothetical protein